MAEMKPIGVDQTDGQQRSIESTDSVVNNIGSQIDNGEFLTVGHFSDPRVTNYQTDQTLPSSGVLIIRGVKREGD